MHAGQVIRRWLGPLVLEHEMICSCVGERDSRALLAHYRQHRATLQKFSPINHLDAADPPVFLEYAAGSAAPADSEQAAREGR